MLDAAKMVARKVIAQRHASVLTLTKNLRLLKSRQRNETANIYSQLFLLSFQVLAEEALHLVFCRL